MTTYTNITKPSGTSYTNQNGGGREQYDQSTLMYDDSSTYYDGINPNQYTNISKPANGANYTWSQASFAWSSATFTWQSDSYTRIAKPT